MTDSMCPFCGGLFSAQAMRVADPIPSLIPRHARLDRAGEECPGTGQNPRNPESDARPLWSGARNPHFNYQQQVKEQPVLRVHVRCESGHEQTIGMAGMSREWVETYAGLLDGTSAMYKFPPGPESVIGKCGICGKPIKATVLGQEEGV